MNVAEPYAVLFTKLLEPEVGSIVVHRASVPLDEQTAVVLPLVANSGALFVLFLSQLPQHIHNVLRVLLRSLGLLCFRYVGIDTFLCRLHTPVQRSVRYLQFLAGSLYPISSAGFTDCSL